MLSRFARPFAGLLAAAALALPLSVSAPADPASAAPPHPSNTEWGEERILQHLNAARAQAGLGPVRRHAGADHMAQYSANVQAWYGRLGHNPNLARDVTNNVTPRWNWAGENVGCGASADHLHQMWMSSASHRAVALKPGADTVGIGAAYGRGCVWATVVVVDT